MRVSTFPLVRSALIWSILGAAVIVPLVAAANSPQLAWRTPIYIIAGFAGIIGMILLLFQPLLAGGHLPGVDARRGRQIHRWIGGLLLAAVIIHVGALWVTSPPDVIDALLFASPTPFSVWGVLAMWAVFATALLAKARRRLRPRNWRLAHTTLGAVIVAGTIIHALLIEGTMETLSKIALCALVLAATTKVITDLWGRTRRTR